MQDRSDARDAKSDLERAGETAGRVAGRAADIGIRVGGALFDSAAELLGGWWSSDDARRAADSWNEDAERTCRTHYGSGAAGTDSDGEARGRGESGRVRPKSTHAAMQAFGDGVSGSARVGDAEVSASARTAASDRDIGDGNHDIGDGSPGLGADAATDGFESARPGYHLGWMARQNPAYRNRSFQDIEPELRKIWESRARGAENVQRGASEWPEVRDFVDFAYQEG